MGKALSNTARILKLLKANGSATNRELNTICFRYGARLHELRQEGHLIATEQLKDGLFRFVYNGHTDDEQEVVA